MHVGVESRARQQLSQSLFIVLIGERSRLIEIFETVPPLPEHLFGVVETLRDVPTKSLAKELGEPFPEVCVEEFRIDGDLAVEVRGVSGAVAPARQCSGGQLVQGRGRRVALGVKIPPCGVAKLEQRDPGTPWFRP